jgi:integrase
VQTWLNSLKTQCQCCAQGKNARRPEAKRRCCAVGACCKRYPSARTRKDIRTVLRAALSCAITDELISRNVARMVKTPAGRSRKRKAWTSDEARTFLEAATAAGDPMYAAYVLVLVLGLRKGEVLGLRWEDIDLDTAELTIAYQLQRVRRQLLHRETKTEASDATLPLPDICIAALRRRRAEQNAARLERSCRSRAASRRSRSQ